MTAAGGVPRSHPDDQAAHGGEQAHSVLRMLRPWRAVTFEEIGGGGGDSPQRQLLYPGVCWGAPLSAGWVLMPPGHMATPHLHEHTDLIVSVLAGWVESLLWHPHGGEIRTVQHGPGDMIEIPAGWGHMGSNLSRTLPVVLHETRNDPAFNDDVVTLPEWTDRLHALARRSQRAWRRPADQTFTVIERLLP